MANASNDLLERCDIHQAVCCTLREQAFGGMQVKERGEIESLLIHLSIRSGIKHTVHNRLKKQTICGVDPRTTIVRTNTCFSITATIVIKNTKFSIKATNTINNTYFSIEAAL